MSRAVRQYSSVYTLIGVLLLLLSGCGPKSKIQADMATPKQNIKYENIEAQPTLVIPKETAANKSVYQPPPKKIINNEKVEIILGEAELQNSKISYNSLDRKMTVTGLVIMMNDTKEKITEREFSVTGIRGKDQSSVILKEEESASDKKLLVSAQANCLDYTDNNEIDCNHVVVDVFIFYNNKYYTEQIEVNRTKPKALAPIPPTVEPTPAVTPLTPLPTPAVEAPIQQEQEDQIEIQQTEHPDESIDGRYQGGAETVNLDLLFPKISPVEPVVTVEPEPLPAPSPVVAAPVVPPVAKPVPKDKPLTPDLQQTKNGEVRPINQCFGFPDDGFLRNATSVYNRQQALNKKAYFEVVLPEKKRYYATYEMAEMISRIGEQLNKQYSKTLYVSNISAINGGKINPHASHQNGLDADLAYPTDVANLKFPLVVRMKTREYFPKNYSVEKTYQLLKFLFRQKDISVDRIFVDEKVKKELCTYALSQNELTSESNNSVQEIFENLQHVEGHGDHFHLRIKCSKSDPGCRNRIYKKMESCAPPRPL